MRLTMRSWLEQLKRGILCRVFLDGVDVTNRCTFADEEAGEVTLIDEVPAGSGNKQGYINPAGARYQRISRIHKGKVKVEMTPYVLKNSITGPEKSHA